MGKVIVGVISIETADLEVWMLQQVVNAIQILKITKSDDSLFLSG